jgi:hypothetical protein
MMEYRVINATHDEFHRMANQMIQEGWTPKEELV